MRSSPRERIRDTHDAPRAEPTPATSRLRRTRRWWRDAVVYQVYVRSFADANGDGIGDLAGVRDAAAVPARPRRRRPLVQPLVPVAAGRHGLRHRRLPRRSTPPSGRSSEAEQLIAEARALGIRTIVDIVPNHVSNQHPWFRAALALAARLARARALLVPARARARTASCRRTAGSRSSAAPPGRAPSDDGDPASGTSTCSRPSSPTSTGRTPTSGPSTRTSCASGSTAASRACGSTRPRCSSRIRSSPRRRRTAAPGEHPFMDRDELHDIYRALARDRRRLPGAARARRRGLAARRRAASRATCGPTSCTPPSTSTSSRARGSPARCARRSSRRSPRTRRSTRRRPGCSRTTTSRGPVTRYGRADTSFAFEAKRAGTPTDLERGTRRARAAALLAMALPGSMYVYQGEELGLPEVEDIPADRRQDPMWLRSGGVDPGRDGCRVPLPWAGDRPPYGFSADGADRPWLDQPDDWARAHRRGQSARRDVDARPLPRRPAPAPQPRPGRATPTLRWLPSPDAVLAFARGERFVCLVNFGPDPVHAAGRRRRPHRQRRARRRCAPARHHGLAPPGERSGSVRRHVDSDRNTAIGAGQRKGRTMKSTRMATIAAVAAASLLAVCRSAISSAAAKSSADARSGHDQRRVADPGQHAGGDPAVQQPGQAVREGEPDRSRSSRSSTSGPARRSRPSSPPARCRPCSRCRSPTPARSATTASSPT